MEVRMVSMLVTNTRFILDLKIMDFKLLNPLVCRRPSDSKLICVHSTLVVCLDRTNQEFNKDGIRTIHPQMNMIIGQSKLKIPFLKFNGIK